MLNLTNTLSKQGNLVSINAKGKRFVTHNGVFHADDVVAAALLCFLYSSEIVRTRETRDSDFLFDVGGSFDPEAGHFDHHQRNFDLHWFIDGEEACKMATAGIVWEYFGKEYITKILALENIQDAQFVPAIHDAIRPFMFYVDAIDVGRGDLAFTEQGQETFSQIISQMNALNAYDVTEQAACFDDAVSCVLRILRQKVLFECNRLNFLAVMDEAVQKYADSDILVLDTFGPWIEYAINHWQETEHFKLAIYPSGGSYRVQTFPKNPEVRQSMRCPAPEEWRGLKGEDLVSLTGIPDLVFVHGTGFIGGAGTRKSALHMAERWIA